MELTETIRRIRQTKGVSQAEIARRLNLERGNYSRLENRGLKLTLEQATAIAQALDMTLVELLTWSEQVDHKQTASANEDQHKRISELEDKLKDKQFIIDRLNGDIEHTSRLINVYMEYLRDEVSSHLRVGTLHYTDDTGNAVSVLIKDISEEEDNRLWWNADNVYTEISDDEEELIMKTLFTDKEFAMIAFYFMSTGFIKDEKLIDAYGKYQSHMADELPVFHIWKLMNTNNPVVRVLEKSGITSKILKGDKRLPN